MNTGVGLDIGTMNIVAARQGQSEEGKPQVTTRRVRDAFIDLPREHRKMLTISGRNYIEREEDVLVIDDAALQVANMLGKEARRPLKDGIIAAGEFDAQEVLGVMIKHVLGEPQSPEEICFFSVPANPVDRQRDTIYHRGVFNRIIADCGYAPYASNEAMAIIFAETAQDDFSGIAISFGAGLCNIALALNTIEGLTFSVSRGGDWVDAGAAISTDSTASRMCQLKEDGLDLMDTKSRYEEALALYYRELIEYCLTTLAAEFKKISGRFALPKPVPLIVSGGTSLAKGFLPFFKQVFERKRKGFPIEISQIRQAQEPINAVAQGLLVQARLESEED